MSGWRNRLKSTIPFVPASTNRPAMLAIDEKWGTLGQDLRP